MTTDLAFRMLAHTGDPPAGLLARAWKHSQDTGDIRLGAMVAGARQLPDGLSAEIAATTNLVIKLAWLRRPATSAEQARAACEHESRPAVLTLLAARFPQTAWVHTRLLAGLGSDRLSPQLGETIATTVPTEQIVDDNLRALIWTLAHIGTPHPGDPQATVDLLSTFLATLNETQVRTLVQWPQLGCIGTDQLPALLCAPGRSADQMRTDTAEAMTHFPCADTHAGLVGILAGSGRDGAAAVAARRVVREVVAAHVVNCRTCPQVRKDFVREWPVPAHVTVQMSEAPLAELERRAEEVPWTANPPDLCYINLLTRARRPDTTRHELGSLICRAVRSSDDRLASRAWQLCARTESWFHAREWNQALLRFQDDPVTSAHLHMLTTRADVVNWRLLPEDVAGAILTDRVATPMPGIKELEMVAALRASPHLPWATITEYLDDPYRMRHLDTPMSTILGWFTSRVEACEHAEIIWPLLGGLSANFPGTVGELLVAVADTAGVALNEPEALLVRPWRPIAWHQIDVEQP